MSTGAAAPSLKAAVQHQLAGRLEQAEAICRELLASQPGNADALHMLGVLALQTNRHDAAVDWIGQALVLQPLNPICHNSFGSALRGKARVDEAIVSFGRAIELKPDFAVAHSNLASALRARGRLDEAIRSLERVVELKPNQGEAHFDLGKALKDAGRLDEALACLQRGVRLKPAAAGGHFALGNALKDGKRLEEAIACYRRAVALDGNVAEVHINLGSALFDTGRFDEAIVAYQRALSLRPQCAQALFNLGNALREKGQIEQAVERYRQALELTPEHPEIHNNLGNALGMRGQAWMEEAIVCFGRAVALKPDFAEAHTNLGNALSSQGRSEEAMVCFNTALSINPDCADTHLMMSMGFLLQGDMRQGWEKYEWRWKNKKLKAAHRSFSKPKWDGSNLAGRALLVHAEQGLGDTLQFIRYLPMAGRRGGKVVFECQPQLLKLARRSMRDISCLAKGEALPPFDVHCPLLSLPLVFGTTLDSIPREVPYLEADPDESRRWQEKLAGASHRLKVGLVWAGNKDHQNDHNRSIELSKLAGLGGVAGVGFYSLQKGEPAQQARSAPPALQLVDWSQDFGEFDQTAGLIANLDLVIAVDTAVAHLAGAMGKAVWTLLPFSPDWRWMTAREDSPWYPTMRLFRQPKVGDWESVIARVADALSELTGDKSANAQA